MSNLVLKDRVPRQYDPQTMVSLFSQLEQFLNRLNQFQGTGTAAPSIGTWVVGDWIINSAPSSGGYFGFVCTTGGSPGTWKGFGAIA